MAVFFGLTLCPARRVHLTELRRQRRRDPVQRRAQFQQRRWERPLIGVRACAHPRRHRHLFHRALYHRAPRQPLRPLVNHNPRKNC